MGKPKTKTTAKASKTSRAKTSSKRAAKAKTRAKAKPKARAKAKPKAKPKPKQSSRLKLTQEIIDNAAEIVGRGNFRYVARGKLGIPEGTWCSWMTHGRKNLREVEGGSGRALSLQAKLVMALDKAENDVHARIIEDVLTSDNLKLKVEYLYRRYGKLYSKNPNAHDDDTGETVKVDPLELLAEKLAPYMEDA